MNKETKDTVRILSIDGGGVRGLISLRFLEAFENITGQKVIDYFDVICGTSIGGLCALALANGSKVTDLIKLLEERGPVIFDGGPADWKKFALILMSPNVNPFLYYNCYDSDGNRSESAALYSQLRKLFEHKKISDLNKDKVVIVTSLGYKGGTPGGGSKVNHKFQNVRFPYSQNDLKDMKTVCFSNYQSQWTEGQDLELADVALATSAAPIYFPPVQMSKQTQPDNDFWYIDGGIFTNNPSDFGLTAAKNIYPDAKKYCILSVGTGSKFRFKSFSQKTTFEKQGEQSNIQVNPANGFALFSSILGLTIDGGMRAADIPLRYTPNSIYYRFQADLRKESIESQWALDNVSINFPQCFREAAEKQWKEDEVKIKKFIEDSK